VIFADDVDVFLSTVRGATSALQAHLRDMKQRRGPTKLLMTLGLGPCLGRGQRERSVSALARAVGWTLHVQAQGDDGIHTPQQCDPNRSVVEALALAAGSSPFATLQALRLATLEAASHGLDDAVLGSMATDLRRALVRRFQSDTDCAPGNLKSDRATSKSLF
jgi:hypothetical protein